MIGYSLRLLSLTVGVIAGTAAAATPQDFVEPAASPARIELPESVTAERIPPRPANAITGSEFAHLTTDMSGGERQQRAVDELKQGNIPPFLRNLIAVRLAQKTHDGKRRTAVIWVMPDYLAIGSNEDFLRIPLTYPTATEVANAFGFVLPTRKIVDAIYEQATVKLRPSPMKPGPKMRSSDYYFKHQRTIEAQRAGQQLGQLVAGHKKDVVITNRLAAKPGHIAIYGWQRRATGKSIQRLSTVHDAEYADYSHGIRLVSETVWIDGEPHPILDVLGDKNLAQLLTYESVISWPSALMRRRPE